jgi:hypothetical protein
MIPVAGVPTITSTVTTRIWMDRNWELIGLDINTITSKQILDSTVVCTSRASDGHQIIRWNSSTSGTPNWYTIGDKQTC